MSNADTTSNVTEEASTISTPSGSQYDTLQYEYNNDINHHTTSLYSRLQLSCSGHTNGYLDVQHDSVALNKSITLAQNKRDLNTINATKDKNYKIIPSPVHKSYVEIIK